MKIIRNAQESAFTLAPVLPSEKETIAQIIKRLRFGDIFRYEGREQDGEYCKIHLSYGSAEGEEGILLLIEGTTPEDKEEVCAMRDICFFGRTSITIIGTVTVEGADSLIITMGWCQHCQAPIIRFVECEWSTCNACAEKCDHDYVEGLVHGGDAGDGAVGMYCKKCGRAKPTPPGVHRKTQAERHVEIEQKLGIQMLYSNTPLTPADVVELEKAQGAIPPG